MKPNPNTTKGNKLNRFSVLDYLIFYLLGLYLMPVPLILVNLFIGDLPRFEKSFMHPILMMAFYLPLWYALAKFRVIKK